MRIYFFFMLSNKNINNLSWNEEAFSKCFPPQLLRQKIFVSLSTLRYKGTNPKCLFFFSINGQKRPSAELWMLIRCRTVSIETDNKVKAECSQCSRGAEDVAHIDWFSGFHVSTSKTNWTALYTRWLWRGCEEFALLRWREGRVTGRATETDGWSSVSAFRHVELMSHLSLSYLVIRQ